MKHKRDYTADRRLPYLCAIALLIAALSTGAAWLLLKLIALFTNLFYFQRLSFAASSPASHTLGWIAALLPVAGGLIVGLMARYGSEKIRGHGIPEAIEAILFGKSRMSPRVAVLKPLSSGIVIGSGGPFGAEGPIIMTGGSVGSLLGQWLHLTAAERKTLLVCGACAGMTAIFGTPLAAVLLAVELLLFELRPRSLLPVALACAVAGFLRPWVLEADVLFPLQVAAPAPMALLSCLAAGLASGSLAALLTLALYRIEDGFHRLPLHWMWWPALGGIAVGLGGLLQPRALGVGYDVIADLLNQHILVSAAVALLVVKAVIWLLALGSGTSGGVLAPLLMMGAGLGLVLAPWLPGGSPGLWPLVCMAAVLGSVLGAPLTAIVFAFGLTHASNALLPLIATTAVAYGVNVLWMKRSIMTEKIARRGLHVHREYGVDPLERMHVEDLMSAPQALDAALPAGAALAQCRAGTHVHRYYPVTHGRQLLGMLALRTLEAADPAQVCGLLLEPDRGHLLPHLSARTAAGMMARLGVARLPVVAGPERRQLVGMLSLSDLARASAAHAEEESVREKLLGNPGLTAPHR